MTCSTKFLSLNLYNEFFCDTVDMMLFISAYAGEHLDRRPITSFSALSELQKICTPRGKKRNAQFNRLIR